MNTPLARNTDPHTSHDAAASVENLTRTRRRIITLLTEFGPLTDPAIRTAYVARWGNDVSESGLRTRRRELCNQALVRDSGTRIPLPQTGRSAIVWEVSPR